MSDLSSFPPNDDDLIANEAVDVAAARSMSALGTGALVARGTFWVLLQSLSNKLVMFIGQLALAQLLAPDDFGKIGMAYTVTTFVALLINPGIDVILVRRGKRFDLWSTPALSFSLTMAALGCLAILVISPIAAWAYKTPQLVGLLTVLAVATPLGSLLLAPTAKLRSQMRFRELAGINLFQAILQTSLTLGFAMLGFGVYAFVLPVPIVYLVVAVILWAVARPALKLRRPFRHWRYLIGDSSYIFGTQLLITLVTQCDYIVLGLLYGAAVVGPYFFAYGLAVQAIRLTAGSLQLVLMAGLTQMKDNSRQQTQAALRASRAIALCGIPLCMIQAAVAGPLLMALYGEKWTAAIPLVQLISFGMAFDVASWAAFSLLQSRGQFQFLFLWSCCFAPIFVAAVFSGALLGESYGVAMATCVYYATFSPLLVGTVFYKSGVSTREIANIYIRPLLVGLLAAGAALSVIHLSSNAGLPLAVQAGLAVIAGLIAMAVGARVLMSSAWHDIMERLRQLTQPLWSLRS